MDKDQLIPQNDDEILDAFIDLMAERIPDDPEEIDTLLREAGLQPEQIEAEVTALIAEARAKTPLDWRNRREEMEEVNAKHQLASTDMPSDRQGLLDLFRRLAAQSSVRTVYAHYRGRNLEELPDEELRSLIQDMRFVSGKNPGDSDDEGSQ